MRRSSFFLRAFTEDLPLKVVSLVIALSLFAIVRSDKDAAASARVPVVYTLPRDRVLVNEPVAELRVSVRGPWTRLSRFDDRAVEPVRIDLTGRATGTLRFDESMVKLPPGLRVASISPSEMRIDFETRVERDLPVQPILEGQPAPGFHVAGMVTTPQTIHVEGPRRAVEGMGHVATRPLSVDGARAPLHGAVALAPPPALVKMDAVTVEVVVDVKPAIVERVLADLPIKIIGLQRLAADIEPSSARVILRGPRALVDGVTPDTVTLAIEASLVDAHAPAKFLRSVAVNGLPAGVAAEVQPDTVMLSTHRKRD
jgi:YbbR domain-containing protein